MIPYMAKIEYLESTGTQYINTGMLPNATDTLNIDFKLPVLNSGAIMGFRYKTRNNLVELWCSASNKFQAATGDVDLTNIADADTEMHHFSINPKSGTATLDGNSTYVGNYTVNNPRRPYLFCTGIGNVASNFSRVRIYRFYIEGKIDLVPIRIGSVGYMYDKISGNLFGNSGTGKFVLGPDVEILSYANEIAFLESTGSQYIDTGYIPNSNTVIEASVAGLEVNCVPFGVRWTGTPTYDTLGLYFASVSPNMVVYWGNYQNNEVTRVDKHLQKKVGVKIGLTQIDIDGNQYPITRGSISNTYSLYLFGMNNMGEANTLLSSRIYNLKIIENNTTLFDFIPVEYNNIGYLYDKVSGEFFANQGTGKFVLGHRAPRFDGKACARSYTRRQLMLEKSRRFSLLYHWEASDGIVNNQWIDRRKGYAFTKQGSPAVTTVSGYEVMRTNYDNYFKVNLNSPALNMGSEWMIAIEFIIAIFPTDVFTYLLDFGSLGNATHAFGFSVSTSKGLSMNVKLAGNTNTFRPPTPPVEFVESKMSTIIFGAEPYDSTHNNIYTIVEGVKTSASSHPTIANCRFNGNFSSSSGFFGRGWDNNTGYQSKSYKYIKSIKIYKDNKKR